MSNSSSSSSGIGFGGLLTVLFVGLKLTGFIDWSWWIGLAIALFIILVVVIMYFAKEWK